MEAKHTPPPWDYHIAENAPIFHIAIEAQDGERIADVYQLRDYPIIIAAPDLLTALEDFVNNGWSARAAMNAKEIITKVRGAA